jgi:hypothetical protein
MIATEQVDDNAGRANNAEPEELDPVTAVAYEYVVPEAFHHVQLIPLLLGAARDFRRSQLCLIFLHPLAQSRPWP